MENKRMPGIRVKVFESWQGADKFAKEVQDFINDERILYKDIQFRTTHNSETQETGFAVMIIYTSNK